MGLAEVVFRGLNHLRPRQLQQKSQENGGGRFEILVTRRNLRGSMTRKLKSSE